MADSPEEERDSASPSPGKELSRSLSRSTPRARSTSRSLPRPRVRSEIVIPGTTLYVSGLSTKVTDKDIEAHFSKEGKVVSCFLVLDPRTRVSRGYAFVTMDSLKDAERCIKNLNQSVLEGQYITVEKSRRTRPRTPIRGHNLSLKSPKDTINGGVSKDSPSSSPRKEQHRSLSGSMPSERFRSRSSRPISPSRTRGRSESENPCTTLCVAGLSTRVTKKDLEAHFSKEGKVASCVLVMEPHTLESRGFAFVTMDSLKDAERCIKNLHKSVLDGRQISVKWSRRTRPRTPTPGHNLSLKSSRDAIYGGVLKDSPSSSPRKEQLRSLSGSMPSERSRSRSLSRLISPSRTRGRSESENPGTTLFVAGLSTRVTEKNLEAHFSKEGKVASCVLVLEPRTLESRGFAFVTMDSLKGAERCIKYLNQSVLEGGKISVKRSRRKRPRTPTPGHYLGVKISEDTIDDGVSKDSPSPSPRKEQSRSLSRSMLRARSRSRSFPRPISPSRSRGRSPRRRDHSPRDGRRSPRCDHSPRDGRRSPRRNHSPRDRRRSPRRNHSPRDERRSPRRDHSPRDRRRSPRRGHSPRDGRRSPRRDHSSRDVRRSPRRNHSSRDVRRSPRRNHSPRDGRRHEDATIHLVVEKVLEEIGLTHYGRRRDRRSERRYQPRGSR